MSLNQSSQFTSTSCRHLFLVAIWIVTLHILTIATSQLAHAAVEGQTEPEFTTIITVNTVADPEPLDRYATCGFEAEPYVPNNECSLRRAMIEASNRPEEDRPILIAFALPTSQENTERPDTWIIHLESPAPGLSTYSAYDAPNSRITIDGSTQPTEREDGPSVFISTANDILINSAMNTIRHVGFFGGGGIRMTPVTSSYKDTQNLLEYLWIGLAPDGQSPVLADETTVSQLAGGQIQITSNSNTIQQSRFLGSPDLMIQINGDSNVVRWNNFGMKSDGTVPVRQEDNRCENISVRDDAVWYGGGGLTARGNANVIFENRFAGLRNRNHSQTIISVRGRETLIGGNVLGIDATGEEVGNCGYPIHAEATRIESTDQRIKILQNIIVNSNSGERNRDYRTDDDIAIRLTGDEGVTVRQNLIKNSGIRSIVTDRWGPESVEEFEPAIIANVDGKIVTGTSHPDSPCPNCIVELYLDNNDETEEALELVGTAKMNASGNFTAELSKAIPNGFVLRTVNIIGVEEADMGTDTGMTSKMSSLRIAPTELHITGLAEFYTADAPEYEVSIATEGAEGPFTFTVETGDEDEPLVWTKDEPTLQFSASFRESGHKIMKITASNAFGSISKSVEIDVYDYVNVGEIIGPYRGGVNQNYAYTFHVQDGYYKMPLTYQVSFYDGSSGSIDRRKDQPIATEQFTVDAHGITRNYTWENEFKFHIAIDIVDGFGDIGTNDSLFVSGEAGRSEQLINYELPTGLNPIVDPAPDTSSGTNDNTPDGQTELPKLLLNPSVYIPLIN